MAENQVKEETQDQKLDVKVEANCDDENTMYIGVDPEHLFEELDVGKLFGLEAYLDIHN